MRITQFEGMAPRIDPSRLSTGLAEEAVNATFQRGALTALPLTPVGIGFNDLMTNQTGSLSRATGLFYSHMADAWFAFNDTVRTGVDSLISPEDQWGRIYFADSTGPRYMVSDQYTKKAVNRSPASYRLGVPVPSLPPSVSVISSSIPAEENDTATRQRVFYVFTLVDDYGHEGPPSPASNHADIPTEYGFEVEVSLPTSGTDLTGRPFTANSKKRIYRATQGTQGNAYQYVGEVAFTSSSFSDTVAYGDEAEVIPSESWYAPPSEIKEIDAIASNFLAGYFGNMVCFSQIKLPHAWPYAFRFPLRYQVTAIRSTANGLFIGTTGKPYWAYGADPEAAVPQELDYDFPCLSRESVVDISGAVLYATHDGIAAVDGQQARLISEDYFTRKDWKDLGPESIKSFAYEGHYVFYSPSTGKAFALDPTNQRSLVLLEWPSSLSTEADNWTVAARDERRDRTILAIGGGTGAVLVEATSSPGQTVRWLSPKVRGAPRHYTFGQVIASDYPVDLTLYAGDSTFTLTVQSERLFRLPAWRREREWQIKVEFASAGSSRTGVYELTLSGSGEELRHYDP